MKHIVKTATALVLVLTVMLTASVFAVGVAAEELYVISDTYLDVGSQTCAIDSSVAYTVFALSPSDVGEFTITVNDGKIGLVSYTDMWVQNDPSDDNVNGTAVEWTCTAVGQGILVAVKSSSSEVTIQVKSKTLVVEEEVPWIVYENKHTPQPFTYSGDFKDMEYVDTFDAVCDEAVLGEDGYYHLNSATGPMLYACLWDSVTLNLQDANSYGQLKQVLVDGDGKIYERTDFHDAFDAYCACADANTGLYPLTEDLIEVFIRTGSYHEWYGEGGFIGGNLDDAWMFACYYTEDDTTVTFPTGTDATTTTNENGVANTTIAPNGRPTPSAPTETTGTAASGDETTATTVNDATTTAANGDAATTTVGGNTSAAPTVNGETAPTANGETNANDNGVTDTTVGGETTATVPNGETDPTVNSETDTTVNGETDTTDNGVTDTTVGGDTNTTAPNGETTTAGVGATTAAGAETVTTAANDSAQTEQTTAPVTDTAPTQGATQDSPPTGDVSNAIVFAIVLAGAVVVMAATSKKATAR